MARPRDIPDLCHTRRNYATARRRRFHGRWGRALRGAAPRSRRAARGVGRRLRRKRPPCAAGRRTRHRQDPHRARTDEPRHRSRRPDRLGTLPRGGGRAAALAMDADPAGRGGRRGMPTSCGPTSAPAPATSPISCRRSARACRISIRPRLSAIPSGTRFRLFGSIARFLINASRRQCLVLVLDDLHWADVPSLRLLEFLAQEMADSRLLIVGTYRETELSRRHRLSDTLGALGAVAACGAPASVRPGRRRRAPVRRHRRGRAAARLADQRDPQPDRRQSAVRARGRALAGRRTGISIGRARHGDAALRSGCPKACAK